MSTIQGLQQQGNEQISALDESLGASSGEGGRGGIRNTNNMPITMSTLFREKAEFSEDDEDEEDDEDLELVLQQQQQHFKNQASLASEDEDNEARTSSTQSSDFIDAEKCIFNDPWDLRSWFTLVEDAAVHDRGGLTTGIMALERMIAQFPMSSYVWNHYISHCLRKNNLKRAKELFDRCLFSTDNEGNNFMKTSEVLWLSYLRFTKVSHMYVTFVYVCDALFLFLIHFTLSTLHVCICIYNC